MQRFFFLRSWCQYANHVSELGCVALKTPQSSPWASRPAAFFSSLPVCSGPAKHGRLLSCHCRVMFWGLQWASETPDFTIGSNWIPLFIYLFTFSCWIVGYDSASYCYAQEITHILMLKEAQPLIISRRSLARKFSSQIEINTVYLFDHKGDHKRPRKWVSFDVFF